MQLSICRWLRGGIGNQEAAFAIFPRPTLAGEVLVVMRDGHQAVAAWAHFRAAWWQEGNSPKIPKIVWWSANFRLHPMCCRSVVRNHTVAVQALDEDCRHGLGATRRQSLSEEHSCCDWTVWRFVSLGAEALLLQNCPFFYYVEAAFQRHLHMIPS